MFCKLTNIHNRIPKWHNFVVSIQGRRYRTFPRNCIRKRNSQVLLQKVIESPTRKGRKTKCLSVRWSRRKERKARKFLKGGKVWSGRKARKARNFLKVGKLQFWLIRAPTYTNLLNNNPIPFLFSFRLCAPKTIPHNKHILLQYNQIPMIFIIS